MEVAWVEPGFSRAPAVAQDVNAAKLHVLQLDPIKARLGPRWPRLSHLVHKLFEKALHRAQGPRDHYLAVGELSYVATFHGLSQDEAALACAAGATASAKRAGANVPRWRPSVAICASSATWSSTSR